MKKFLSVVIVLLSVFAYNVNAEELVSIENIKCDNMFNGNLIENIKVENERLNLKVGEANFHHINDYLECTLDIKNISGDKISVDEVNFNNQTNEYIKYELTYDNKNVILKDEVRTYRVKVTYLKEYANDIDLNNKLSIRVSSNEKEEEVENPKTGLPTYTAIIVTVGALGCTLIFLKHRKVGMFKGLVLFLFLSISIPLTVNALVTNVVNLESNIHVSVDKYYNVTIDPNGGMYNGSNEIYQERVLLGTEIDLSNIKRDGFEFVSWTLNETDSFKDTKIIINKDTNLKAVWNEIFTLEVDPNGGLYNNDASIYTKEVTGGYELDLSNIKYDGYVFSHWLLNGKDKYTEQKIIVNDNVKLKAIWLKEYNVTIDPNGGLYNGSNEVYQAKVASGTEIDLTNISRDKYLVDNWTLNGTEKYTGNKITITEDTTLVANWIVAVARIEQKYYASIMKAHEAAKTNDVIVLLMDTEEIVTSTKTVTLDLDKHKVTGYVTNTGNLTIIDGTIECLDGAAVRNTGTLTLGENDLNGEGKPNVSIDSVALIGTDVGLLQNGTFNFYDGFIEGKVGLAGGYNDKPVGYIVFVDHNDQKDCQKVYLVPAEYSNRAVAKTIVGGVILYFNLQDAFNSGMYGDMTVYAIRNFEAAHILTIPKGEKVIFDIIGFTVNTGNDIYVNGTYTITDTGEPKGVLQPSITITNNGVLNIKDVAITATTDANIINNNSELNVMNSIITALKGNVVYNTKGNITLDSKTYLHADEYAIKNEFTETVEPVLEITIAGGNISGVYNNFIGNITIKDSNLFGKSNGVYNNNLKTNLLVNNCHFENVLTGINNSQGNIEVNNTTTKTTRYGIISSQGNSVINSGKFESTEGAAATFGDGNTIINGGTFIGKTYGIFHSYIGSGPYYSGTITINDGEIRGGRSGISGIAGVTVINSGNIYGIQYGIENTTRTYLVEKNVTCTVNVNGGNITGGLYGIYQTGGTTNVGTDDGKIITSKPVIVGDSYGMYMSGTVNFNDGIIKGQTDASYGEVIKIPDATLFKDSAEIINNKSFKTKYLIAQTAFVRVNGVPFNSLQKAIDSVEMEGNLEFMSNAISGSLVTIPKEKTITIDLKGYTYSSSQQITNAGTLTLKDTSATEQGKFEITGKYGIYNSGTFYYESGLMSILTKSTAIYNNTNAKVEVTKGNISVNSEYCANSVINKSGSIKANNLIINMDCINGGTAISTDSGTIELTNSHINITSPKFGGENRGIFMLGSTVTIIDSEINIFAFSGKAYGILGILTNKEITLTRSNITTGTEHNTAYGIKDEGSAKINIMDSTIKSSTNYPTPISYGIHSYGTINLNNSYVEGIGGESKGIVSTGTLNIEDGTVIGKTNGIESSGELNIKAGTIKGEKYGINQSGAGSITTLGNDDSDIAITSPVIIGKEYGININAGTVKFYDGILKGQTAGYFGTISITADASVLKAGIETISDVQYNTNFLVDKNKFAKVNNIFYNSLQKAIDSIETEGTIELISDAVSSNTVTIPSGKNITIDLSGFTYTSSQEFTNGGILTIKDSSSNKTGNIHIDTNITVKGINNKANSVFNLESGKIFVTSTASSYGIYNDGTTNIYGGEINIDVSSGAYYTIYNSRGTLKTTGGKILLQKHEGNRGTGYTIYNYYGTLSIDSTTVNENVDTTTGYAVYIEGGTNTVVNSYIKSPLTGIRFAAGSLTMTGGSVTTGGTAIAISGQATISDVSVTSTTGGVSVSGNANLTRVNVIINNTNETYAGSITGVGVVQRGTLNIKDSTIKVSAVSPKAKVYGISNDNGSYHGSYTLKTTLTNTDVEAKGEISYGIYTYNGVSNANSPLLVNINNGTIKGELYGVYLVEKETGTQLNLGTDDGTISSTSPVIIGGTYGIYDDSGIINFYDGIIKGKTGAYFNTIGGIANGAMVETGYEIINENEFETKYLVEATALVQNGDKQYIDLKLAIDEAVSGDILTFLRDTGCYYPLEIPADKNITLDLNGHDITTSYTIVNLGALNIINTSTDSSTFTENGFLSLIENKGTLTVDNINFIGKKYRYIINNNSLKKSSLKNTSFDAVAAVYNMAGSNLIMDNVTMNTTRAAVNNAGKMQIDNSDINTKISTNEYETAYVLYTGSGREQELTINNTKISGEISNGFGVTQMNNVEIVGIISNGYETLNINKGSFIGAITNLGNMELSELEMNSGSFGDYNYLIDNQNNMTINNSSMHFKGYADLNAIASIMYNTGTLTLNNMKKLTFSNSFSSRNNYAIYNNKTGSIIADQLSIDMIDTSSVYGIFSDSTENMTIDNLNITSNIPSTYVAYLRGVYINGTGTLTTNVTNINLSVGETTSTYKTFISGVFIGNGGGFSMKTGNIIASSTHESYGIQVNNGTATIGEAESMDSPNYGTGNANVSTTNPLIQATGTVFGIGVKKDNGYFNFYDGKIIGSTNAKPDTTSTVEYNYEATNHIDPDTGYEYCVLEYLK